MGLSDELGAIMRAHDDEAPTVVDLPARPWGSGSVPRPISRRRAVLLPLAAAAAVLVLVAGALTLGRARDIDTTASQPTVASTSGPALAPVACPASFDARGASSASTIWVPARPSGVDTHGHLVPDATPSSVVVCSYAPTKAAVYGDPDAIFPLAGRRVLGGNLDEVRDELVWLPPARRSPVVCTSDLPFTDFDNYVIGLRYPGRGTVWISAPGDHCEGSSNGVVTAAANLRASAASAFARDRWTATITPASTQDPCDGGISPFGRFGQQSMLVPGRPTAALVCTIVDYPVRGGRSSRTTRQTPVSGPDLTQLVSRLDALPTSELPRGCSSGSIGSSRYEVRFDYGAGPSMTLTVDQGNTCFGDALNGSLRSQSSATVLPLLDRLTR